MCWGAKQPSKEDAMSPEQEDRIKQRAYEIWEREGHPEGRGDVHWLMAVEEIRAEDGRVDDAADFAGPTDDLSRQLGSAEASLAPEGVGPAESALEEPAPVAPRKPRARKAAAKVEATGAEPAAEAAEDASEVPKPKARKSASPRSATAKSAAATKEAVEKPKRAAKVKA
jgi:hypothetical protein